MEPRFKSFLDYYDESDDLNIDAKLSKAAYTQEERVGDWVRDAELSNQNRSVYTKDGKAKIAFRGTDLTKASSRWDDLGTDALILLGLQDKGSRFKNAQTTAELTIKKYGKANVTLTGHSLGGAQSAWVSRKTGLKGTGFNAGWGPADYFRDRTYSEFTNVTAAGDIVSVSGSKNKKMKHVKIKPTEDSHSLANFLHHYFPRKDIVVPSAHQYAPREFPVIQGDYANSVSGVAD